MLRCLSVVSHRQILISPDLVLLVSISGVIIIIKQVSQSLSESSIAVELSAGRVE